MFEGSLPVLQEPISEALQCQPGDILEYQEG